MIRLTFRENDKFGVVGMNEENQDKKLYACVLKLTDYEDTGLSPNDILKLKEENDSYNETMKYLNKLRDENNQFKQQLEEKYKEIEKLANDNKWFAMWHNKYQEQIQNLTTELETYRPTKLHGNGQCSCYRCEQKTGFNRHWTDWCSKYKGRIYCNNCLKEILKEEKINKDNSISQELEIYKRALELVCEKVMKEYLDEYDVANGYGCNPKYFVNKAREELNIIKIKKQ